MLDLEEGAPLLYMKVGTHAAETLADIIERKRREIDEAGFALWGYGGNTCHPTTMVQPFAQDATSSGGRIYLVMQPMESKHFADPIRANEYSRDGLAWELIPPAVNVRGSRYALWIKSLDEVEDRLALGDTTVALGNSRGRLGSAYVRGRVDKACLRMAESEGDGSQLVDIRLRAEMVDPFAVFVR
jgi:hypothetical protein